MNDHRSSGPIPNRWLHCPRKSAHLIVDKFIAFKTPLSERYDEHVPSEFRFPPKMLFQHLKSKKVQIGLWIDLTNTNRFYDKQDIEEEDCKYYKLKCRGHGETPSPEQTDKFVNICHNFIEQNPLKVIAVHCTHGFNRTGFLIVSYLVRRMDFGVAVALQEFNKARPPGIYKQDYLNELFKLYDDEEDTPPAPQLPDWCFEDENSADRDDIDSIEDSNNGNPSKDNGETKIPRKRNQKMPVFMTGVSGVIPCLEQPTLYNIQKKVQMMCCWKNRDFPGSQPVSMDRQNMEFLAKKPYRVSWKADGTRYMMLIDGERQIYFIDRDNNAFLVEGISFPSRKDYNKHVAHTLVDGEMVIDKVNGQDIPRYLIYDIIKFEDINVGKEPFYPVRLRCINDELIQPRYAAIKEGRINKTREPFSIRMKDFWDITQTSSLLGDKFSKMLSHEPDGLIFQPSKEPYIPGRCDSVLKWKPLDMNSVDFRLKIVKEGGPGIIPCKIGCLYVGQLDKPYGKMKFTKEIKNLDNKIIECKYENNKWVFMRERTDKSFPNSFTTAEAVYNSIRNPVTKEDLLNLIGTRRYRDDKETMPPPAKKIRR